MAKVFALRCKPDGAYSVPIHAAANALLRRLEDGSDGRGSHRRQLGARRRREELLQRHDTQLSASWLAYTCITANPSAVTVAHQAVG